MEMKTICDKMNNRWVPQFDYFWTKFETKNLITRITSMLAYFEANNIEYDAADVVFFKLRIC